MKKGAKIGIGIGVVVALGVASYFLFFRKKDKPKKKKSDDDSDSFKDTIYIGDMKYINAYKNKSNNIDKDSSWVNISATKKEGAINKGDIAVISETNEKLDGEYPVLGVWHNKNDYVGAVLLEINKNYKPVWDKKDGKDKTFSGFGEVKIYRKESTSEIGGCGCGAV